MKPNEKSRLNELSKTGNGSVLIAKPFLNEDNYQRSVVLILEHDSHGSVGMIINKPSTLIVKNALRGLAVDAPLYYGGPSDIKTISYLHTYPELPDTMTAGPNLYWGGDFDVVARGIESGRMNELDFKFFAGFVLWLPGQLEREIQMQKWWIGDTNKQEVFTCPPEELWSYKLISSGHPYGLMDAIPDPVLN